MKLITVKAAAFYHFCTHIIHFDQGCLLLRLRIPNVYYSEISMLL
jgi:hypothetical protein